MPFWTVEDACPYKTGTNFLMRSSLSGDFLYPFRHWRRIQRLFSFLPIGHTPRECIPKRRRMIRMEKMREFVHDDVINIRRRIKGKTGIERDHRGLRSATSPTGAHDAQLQLGQIRLSAKEKRIHPCKHLHRIRAQFLFGKALQRVLPFVGILRLFQNEEQLVTLYTRCAAVLDMYGVFPSEQTHACSLVARIGIALFPLARKRVFHSAEDKILSCAENFFDTVKRYGARRGNENASVGPYADIDVFDLLTHTLVRERTSAQQNRADGFF